MENTIKSAVVSGIKDSLPKPSDGKVQMGCAVIGAAGGIITWALIEAWLRGRRIEKKLDNIEEP